MATTFFVVWRGIDNPYLTQAGKNRTLWGAKIPTDAKRFETEAEAMRAVYYAQWPSQYRKGAPSDFGMKVQRVTLEDCVVDDV
jgi:hypothetical protein